MFTLGTNREIDDRSTRHTNCILEARYAPVCMYGPEIRDTLLLGSEFAILDRIFVTNGIKEEG